MHAEIFCCSKGGIHDGPHFGRESGKVPNIVSKYLTDYVLRRSLPFDMKNQKQNYDARLNRFQARRGGTSYMFKHIKGCAKPEYSNSDSSLCRIEEGAGIFSQPPVEADTRKSC